MLHQFECTGCGACCRGRFIPLTMKEAVAWIARGQNVAIMLEAFDQHAGMESGPLQHARYRASEATCGESSVYIIAILAAQAIPACPNLGANDLCQIYDDRPLVCRIYPQEINPYIPLIREAKDCPDEAWEQGQIIETDSDTRRLIEASRDADREDADNKLRLSAELGLSVCGWKGDGLAIYIPSPEAITAALERMDTSGVWEAPHDWKIQTTTAALADQLEGRSLRLFNAGNPSSHYFHAL